MHGILRSPILLALWLLAGGLLLVMLGREPLQRTQEARVLVTAREMTDGPPEDWLIPRLNGQIRLQKPPLAYWASAVAFLGLGTSAWAGRLPMALAAWATLGLTFAWAARIAGRRAGLLAAGGLLGTLMFFRFARLAETDTLILPFLIGALYALWRGMELPRDVPPPDAGATPAGHRLTGRTALCYHLAALCVGLAILGKGAPAMYPVIFLLACALLLRRWRIAWDFARSGAPLTAALVALPWFVYIWLSGRYGILANEIRRLAEGEGHGGWFFEYIPELVLATAPWSLLVLGALIYAIARWRTAPALRGLLIAAGSILLPLAIAPQKQNHYLLPVIPVLMVLVAAVIERLLAEPHSPGAIAARHGLRLSLLAILLAAPAMLITSLARVGAIEAVDVIAATGVLLAGGLALPGVWRQGVRRIGAFAAACIVLVACAGGLWSPRLISDPPSRAADALTRAFGNGPFVFYETRPNLPLVFQLRQTIPMVTSSADALARAQRQRDLVLLFRPDKLVTDEPIPPKFEHRMDLMIEGRKWAAYALAGPQPASAGAAP
jgi:4-amino-4-deoxy-L-arabinose transferase-like glycosyltransferase